MNEQKPPNAIEWTRPYGRRGFTWNVASGCAHDCEWIINGVRAVCYAKTVAERVAQKAYPHGFAHHYFHPERLNEPLAFKEPAGIFLDSMSDLMGVQVPDEQVEAVLDICRKADWHIFFLLTKNAPRLLKFNFPRNVWVGVSSAPDFMYGKQLERKQQEAYMHKALSVLTTLNERDVTTWSSVEPLSWNIAPIVVQYPKALSWVVVGAASDGAREFPPVESDLLALLEVIDRHNVPLFYKGNMRTLPYAAAHWRVEFPPESTTIKPMDTFDTGLTYDQPQPAPRNPIRCDDCGRDMGTPEERAVRHDNEVVVRVHNGDITLCGTCFSLRNGIGRASFETGLVYDQPAFKQTPEPAREPVQLALL